MLLSCDDFVPCCQSDSMCNVRLCLASPR
jgi:hypothetical protein